MSDTRIIRRYSTTTAGIAQSASLSGEIDVGGTPLRAIIMPAAWTAAGLSFQAADKSGGTFANVYDGAGNEINVSAAASRSIGLSSTDYETLGAFQFIKIRSGTGSVPVTQSAARTIIMVLGM